MNKLAANTWHKIEEFDYEYAGEFALWFGDEHGEVVYHCHYHKLDVSQRVKGGFYTYEEDMFDSYGLHFLYDQHPTYFMIIGTPFDE